MTRLLDWGIPAVILAAGTYSVLVLLGVLPDVILHYTFRLSP